MAQYKPLSVSQVPPDYVSEADALTAVGDADVLHENIGRYALTTVDGGKWYPGHLVKHEAILAEARKVSHRLSGNGEGVQLHEEVNREPHHHVRRSAVRGEQRE